MFLRKKLKQLEQGLDQSFDNVRVDVDAIINKINSDNEAHDGLARDFYELRNEIATNGVIRDIRKLQKDVDFLFGFRDDMLAFQDKLGRNGVATAINRLNEEVFESKKEVKHGWSFSSLAALFGGSAEETKQEEVTLAGKVDAIIEHLGLDVAVKPEEVKPAKVVAKKVVTKKKGRR